MMIPCSPAFTSARRCSGDTLSLSIGLAGYKYPDYSAALVLRLSGLSNGAWYPYSGGDDGDVWPLTCRPGSPLPLHLCCTSSITSCDSRFHFITLEHWVISCFLDRLDVGF